jgi:hypothetical protein
MSDVTRRLSAIEHDDQVAAHRLAPDIDDSREATYSRASWRMLLLDTMVHYADSV